MHKYYPKQQIANPAYKSLGALNGFATLHPIFQSSNLVFNCDNVSPFIIFLDLVFLLWNSNVLYGI